MESMETIGNNERLMESVGTIGNNERLMESVTASVV
jgi:hypothetical protein